MVAKPVTPVVVVEGEGAGATVSGAGAAAVPRTGAMVYGVGDGATVSGVGAAAVPRREDGAGVPRPLRLPRTTADEALYKHYDGDTDDDDCDDDDPTMVEASQSF